MRWRGFSKRWKKRRNALSNLKSTKREEGMRTCKIYLRGSMKIEQEENITKSLKEKLSKNKKLNNVLLPLLLSCKKTHKDSKEKVNRFSINFTLISTNYKERN